MITCKLQGGLGNLMFQISTTYSLAIDNDDDCCFDFVNAFYPQQHANTYFDNIFSRVKSGQINIKNMYKEIDFSYNKIPYSENMMLNGYFQSEKYFIHNRKHILDLFKPTKTLSLPNTNKETIGLHIRRGDYLNSQNHHPVCELEYYKMGLSKFTDGDYQPVVFSDDIEWCKENFEEDFIFIDGYTDYEDIWLMSLCNHNIIANSSFSWWGAWLNDNPNKRVIAPKKWFGPAYSNWPLDDLFCNDWEVL